MKRAIAILVVGGAMATMACSVDATEEIGDISDAAYCGEYKYELEAALAVVVAKEMGRWEAHKDFAWYDYARGSLEISAEGYNRCAMRGFTGCPNTSAILKLQTNGGSGVIPGHDPGSFRMTLNAHWQRHNDWLKNNKFVLREAALTHDTTETSQCGNFDWSTVSGGDTALVYEKLIAYGGPTQANNQAENPFLRIQTNSTQIGIDPVGSLTGGGGTTTTGMCRTDSCVYDATKAILGSCCVKNGVYGKYAASTWDAYTFVCKI